MRLRARAVCMRFSSGFVAGPLDLDVGPGVHHLRGPNGVGKSTLLRCLCGVYLGCDGEIELDGRDPRRDVSARAHVGMLSAEPELPGFLTVDEAWSELAAIRGVPGWDGATERARFGLPGGLPLAHCSAGQRRMAEFVAALAGDPGVLLLDEPFANLDPVSTGRLAARLEDLRATRVIVLTGHAALPLVADSVVALVAR